MSPSPTERLGGPEKRSVANSLKESRRWEKFVSLRESLKERGVSGASAWLAAARQLGWVHHENPRRGHWCGESCTVCVEHGEGEQRIEDPSVGITPGAEASPEELEKNAQRKQGSYVNFDRDMVLMPKEMANAKPRQDITADVEWVVENLAVEGVKPADSPTARAWSLYSECKVSQRMKEVIFQHHSKMMPTGKQLEAESAHGDLGAKKLAEFENFLDGEEHVGLLGADALQLQSAENTASERVVSEKDLATRRR